MIRIRPLFLSFPPIRHNFQKGIENEKRDNFRRSRRGINEVIRQSKLYGYIIRNRVHTTIAFPDRKLLYVVNKCSVLSTYSYYDKVDTN